MPPDRQSTGAVQASADGNPAEATVQLSSSAVRPQFRGRAYLTLRLEHYDVEHRPWWTTAYSLDKFLSAARCPLGSWTLGFQRHDATIAKNKDPTVPEKRAIFSFVANEVAVRCPAGGDSAPQIRNCAGLLEAPDGSRDDKQGNY